MPKNSPGIKLSQPQPTNLSKENIYSIAERVAHGVSYVEDFNIARVIKGFGGSVETHEFWDDANGSGALKIPNSQNFSIYVPKHTSDERNRFTIAHELGHYVLHFLIGSKDKQALPFVASRYGTGREEWEANWFAAAFLMPHDIFSRVFEESGGNFFQVARHFKVSTSAARVRAKALGIVADDGAGSVR